MSVNDARAQVLVAAADQESVAALNALASTLKWATAVLAADQPSAGTPGSSAADTEALELVIALDDALTGLPGLLLEADRAVTRAQVGEEVERHVAGELAKLEALRRETARARERHAQAQQREDEWRELAEESDRLRCSIDELTLLRERAATVPELRKEQERLARQVEIYRAPVQAADRALAETGSELVTLNQERLATLDADTRSVLDQVAATQARYEVGRQRHAAALEALRSALQRYEGLAEIESNLGCLTEYARADAELATVLSATAGREVSPDLAGARTATAAVQEQLRSVDRVLARALTTHQEAMTQARRAVRLGSGSVGEQSLSAGG